MPAAWICAGCGRKVPGYVHTCHCGAGRPAVPVAAGPRVPRPGVTGRRIDAGDFTWQVWVALGLMALVLLGAAVSLFLPYERERLVPLLGYADHVPEPPAVAKPTPAKPSPAAHPGGPDR